MATTPVKTRSTDRDSKKSCPKMTCTNTRNQMRDISRTDAKTTTMTDAKMTESPTPGAKRQDTKVIKARETEPTTADAKMKGRRMRDDPPASTKRTDAKMTSRTSLLPSRCGSEPSRIRT